MVVRECWSGRVRVCSQPPRAVSWIPRTALLRRLRAEPLVLLAAPAGYGKTVLAAQVAHASPAHAWLGLREPVADPALMLQLLRHLWLHGGGDSPMMHDTGADALVELRRHFAGLPPDTWLILDGIECVSDAVVRDVLQPLFDELPGHVHVLLTQRVERGATQAGNWHVPMLCLGWQDLAADDLDLMRCNDLARAAAKWSGGWWTAIGARLQLSDGVSRGMRSAWRSLAIDRFLSERLVSLPPASCLFLCQLAVAGRWLLYRALGRLGGAGARLVEDWLAIGMARVEGEGAGRCLLFSPMVTEAAERYLAQHQPEHLELAWKDAAVEARHNGSSDAALVHALRARDRRQVQELLDECGWALVFERMQAPVRQALSFLQEQGQSQPLLALYLALEAADGSGEPAPVSQWQRVLQQTLAGDAGDAGQASVVCLRLMRALQLDDWDTVQQLAPELHPQNVVDGLRSAAWSALAEVRLAGGDLEGASQAWTEALQHARAVGYRHEPTWLLHRLADLARARGQLQQAAALRRQALQHLRAPAPALVPLLVTILLAHVECCLELDELDEAERELNQARSLCRTAAHYLLLAVLQARLYRLSGDQACWQQHMRLVQDQCLSGWPGGLQARLDQQLLDYWASRGDEPRMRLWLSLQVPPDEPASPNRRLHAMNRLYALGHTGQPDEAAQWFGRLREATTHLPVERSLLDALAWELGIGDVDDTCLLELSRCGLAARLRELARSTCLPVVTDGRARGAAPEPALVLLTLSARDRQLLQYLEQGLSNEWIAERMCLAIGSVKNRLTLVYRRLGVRSRAEAVQRWRDCRALPAG